MNARSRENSFWEISRESDPGFQVRRMWHREMSYPNPDGSRAALKLNRHGIGAPGTAPARCQPVLRRAELVLGAPIQGKGGERLPAMPPEFNQIFFPRQAIVGLVLTATFLEGSDGFPPGR